MKPINAFLNIHSEKVVASTVEKPDYWVFYEKYHDVTSATIHQEKLDKAYKDFESSILGEAENAKLHLGVWMLPFESEYIEDWTPIKRNQPCQVEVKGKKITVVKLTD